MAAGKLDFNIEQGTSFEMSFTYTDDNDDPVDLTDWCARLVWTSNVGTETFTTDNVDYSTYKLSIDALLGKITLQFPASTTNEFDFKTTKYDLELQSPDDLYTGGGKITLRLLYGTITIIKRFSQISSNLACS